MNKPINKPILLLLIIAFTNISLQVKASVNATDTTTVNADSLIEQVCDTIELQVNKEMAEDLTVIKILSSWVKVNEKMHYNRFNGHWALIQLGISGLATNNYSAYTPVEGIPNQFMDLKQASSLEINLNFLEWNIALNRQKNIGLVTGMGIGWNNYKFDNPVTIIKNKDDGKIIPQEILDANFRKSKLVTSYLNIPLLLEYQFRVNDNRHKMFVNAGLIGGLNIGSHTKIKANNAKRKDKSSLAINPFKYSGIFQIGGNNLSIYATYSFSELFKNNSGPELTPFSIGINLINF